MKLTNNNKGFTLIELIMVIVILGILSAVVVPKFFDFTAKAHDANKNAVFGAVKSGIVLYATDQLVTNGSRTYPDADLAVMGNQWEAIIEEAPDGWTFNEAGAPDSSQMVYTADGSIIGYGSDGGSTYNLTKSW